MQVRSQPQPGKPQSMSRRQERVAGPDDAIGALGQQRGAFVNASLRVAVLSAVKGQRRRGPDAEDTLTGQHQDRLKVVGLAEPGAAEDDEGVVSERSTCWFPPVVRVVEAPSWSMPPARCSALCAGRRDAR